MDTPLGLYIHVPFCAKKCAYCDFYSEAAQGREERERYVNALVAEIKVRGNGKPADTVFFGGGTPTLLEPAQVARLMGELRTWFVLAPGAEVSMEANPETVDRERLEGFHAAGVNRLSFGVQSFSDHDLAALGRIHDSARALRAVEEARQAGFARLGVDLMFGLPGQAVADWRGNLGRALALPIEHLSAYELSVEEDTPFGRNPPELPGEDEVAEMWEAAREETARAGFVQYEVSNYAKPGRECRHNLKYWEDTDFIGFGPAAWSSRGGVRTGNPASLAAYLAGEAAGFPPSSTDRPDPGKKRAETLMLNLRMTRGCREADFDARYGPGSLATLLPRVQVHLDEGRLERVGGFLRLTQAGMMVANEVWADLLGGSSSKSVVRSSPGLRGASR